MNKALTPPAHTPASTSPTTSPSTSESQFAWTPVASSRIDSVDFEGDLGFGQVFSDHMFSMEYHDKQWHDQQVVGYGPVAMEPGVATLHYGQIIFEGLKAFHGVDGKIRIFRPEMNAKRLHDSCERLCMPTIDTQMFVDAVSALVNVDRQWIPTRDDQAFYIRPLMFGIEPHLDVRPSNAYQFLVIGSPVRAYFHSSSPAIRLKIEERYTRAVSGGTGFAKTAGNYAASLKPGQVGRDEGYDQVLWTDGQQHQYIEEVGQMNIFFHIGDTVVTPALQGTILPGITRDSALTLLKGYGIACEERPVSIEEVISASRDGSLKEAFGTGTAAVVTPVGELAWQGDHYPVNAGKPGELCQRLYTDISGIQRGTIDDVHNWNLVL